jgi:ribosomal protein S18 acetylase RimI-like enzyme
VPTWEGWSQRTAAENRRIREGLFDDGVADGYLLYGDDEVVGWCQALERDRLAKLARQFDLPPDPATWAITCFLIAPRHRRQGLAGRLLREVVADLRRRGAARIEAFPKRGPDLDAGDLWNGPEAMFRAAGFAVLRDDPVRPILGLEFPDR